MSRWTSCKNCRGLREFSINIFKNKAVCHDCKNVVQSRS